MAKDYLFETIMDAHWTSFLEEGGTIKKKGVAQVSRILHIIELKRRINDLEHEFYAEEKDIEDLALTQWSRNEIKSAKDESDKVMKENFITVGKKTIRNHILFNGD